MVTIAAPGYSGPTPVVYVEYVGGWMCERCYPGESVEDVRWILCGDVHSKQHYTVATAVPGYI